MSSIFTRRNYVWLASFSRDLLRTAKTRGDLWDADECARLAVLSLASALADESPAFDKPLFLHNSACTPTHHAFGPDCPFVMMTEKQTAE